MLNSSKFNKRFILKEEQLDSKIDKCPFCFSLDTTKIGTIQNNPQINAKKCNECKIGFADRQPTEAYINDYYKNYYDSDTKYTTIESSTLAKHIIKQIAKTSYSEEYSILDFGGGDGSVSSAIGEFLINKGLAGEINIVIIDYYNQPEYLETKKILINHLPSINELPSNYKYDLVIASAILEHVKEPREISFKLLNLLKPGGKGYFRTPYIFPFFQTLKLLGISIDIQYPGHLFDMGNLFWDSFIKNMNLSNKFRLEKSHTSLVETPFIDEPVKATLSFLLKLPSHFLKNQYHFVGGWEVVIARNHITSY